MAVQEKVNPIQLNVARHFNGKSLTAVTIVASDAGDLRTNLGPNGAFQAIVRSITEYATPVVISAIRGDWRTFDVYFEGEFGTDNWGAAPGTVRTFADYLQDRIRALGTVDGIELVDKATVALMTDESSFQADQINETGVPYTNA